MRFFDRCGSRLPTKREKGVASKTSSTELSSSSTTMILGFLFFSSWFLFSNYIILNLFVAVILENFELAEEEKHRQQQKKYIDSHKVA